MKYILIHKNEPDEVQIVFEMRNVKNSINVGFVPVIPREYVRKFLFWNL